MTHNNYIYIAVMALVSYAIRILPLTLIRKPIKNRFIQSFLYYVPYVTLAVMTFPAIIQAQNDIRALLQNSLPHGVLPCCCQKAFRKGAQFVMPRPLLHHAGTYKAACTGYKDLLHFVLPQ